MFQIWVDGKPCYSAKIVYIYEGENYLDEGWAEPGPSLDDLEIIIGYIKRRFPDGWRIEGGEIRSAK
jgi:hypothetical protein